VLYGLRLTLSDIGRVGAAGVLIDALVVTSTFALAVWVGTRALRIERVTAMLIGAGSAICGAAAVMATEPVVKGKTERAAVAVACVVMFGTPFNFPVPGALSPHPPPFTFSSAALRRSVSKVAQVFAAGRAVSDEAADTAVITKMVRVMMLAPFLSDVRAEITVPWFALGFVAVAALNLTQKRVSCVAPHLMLICINYDACPEQPCGPRSPSMMSYMRAP
jgi:uncharacterized integral membrane protein (TIGR00698 family)